MLTIGFSTRKSNPEFVEYLKITSKVKGVQVIEKINDGEKSLSEVYNEIISESNNDIIVLCHDDIEFDSKNWGKKVLDHFKKNDFGILGVAGTTVIPKSGMWWEDRRKMVGIVNHKDNGKKWESKYSKSWGDDITECSMVDGLFIAINKKAIKSTFDESVKGFHFYDVYFSTKNFLDGVKIGVIYNVRLTHKSVGKTNETWEEYRNIYRDRFKDELPIISKTNIEYDLKQFKYLKKYSIRIVINTGNDYQWVESILERINSFNLPNYNISLICHESISEKIKSKTYHSKIKLYDGFFDDMSKNLSILRWDDDFVTDKDDLIFFIDKGVMLINNVFSSICKIYHSEKPNFGSAYSVSTYDDLSIFSTRVDFINNKDNNVNIILKDNGSHYNVLSGNFTSPIGTFSDVFATTYNNLKNLDWFDIQYETNMCFNDFSLKCFLKNQKTHIDTDSLSTNLSFLNEPNFNRDINKLLRVMSSNQKSEKLILKNNG